MSNIQQVQKFGWCILSPCAMIRCIPLQTSTLSFGQRHANLEVLLFVNRSSFLLGSSRDVSSREPKTTRQIRSNQNRKVQHSLVFLQTTYDNYKRQWYGGNPTHPKTLPGQCKLVQLRQVCLARILFPECCVQMIIIRSKYVCFFALLWQNWNGYLWAKRVTGIPHKRTLHFLKSLNTVLQLFGQSHKNMTKLI